MIDINDGMIKRRWRRMKAKNDANDATVGIRVGIISSQAGTVSTNVSSRMVS